MSVKQNTVHPSLVLLVAWCTDVQEGKAFLEENKGKEGVIETSSGLQYKVIKSGPEDGKTPLKTTKCLCHYRGTFSPDRAAPCVPCVW